MPAVVPGALVNDRAHRFVPELWPDAQLVREIRNAQRTWQIVHAFYEAAMWFCVLLFEVDALRCRWPSLGEVVDADPGEDLVVFPLVVLVIGPVMQLLPDPGKEADWAVGDIIADGLRACTMLKVPVSSYEESSSLAAMSASQRFFIE